MARLIKLKDVQKRIKDNRAIMRKSKKQIIDNMNGALKGEQYSPVLIRKRVTDFITAAKAVKSDEEKLMLVKPKGN